MSSVQYTLDKGQMCDHDSFCYAEGYNQFIGHRVQGRSNGKTYPNATTKSIRIHKTWNLPHEWKSGGCQDQGIPLFHHWHVLCVFPPQVLRVPSHMVLTSPHVTLDHTPRRAIEGCGSCEQEPTNESDVVAILIKFVFIVIDSLQGLEIELVSE